MFLIKIIYINPKESLLQAIFNLSQVTRIKSRVLTKKEHKLVHFMLKVQSYTKKNRVIHNLNLNIILERD